MPSQIALYCRGIVDIPNHRRDGIRASESFCSRHEGWRKDCSRVRYAHPRRVTASSYHPVSGRSLLEDSITPRTLGKGGGRPWRDFLPSNSYGETIASASRRGETANSRLFYPAGDLKTLDRATTKERERNIRRFIRLGSI